MAISLKTEDEIKAMREGGKLLAFVLEETCKKAVAGISTYELDQFAENLIKKHNATPGFKGYGGFPATLCTAINEVIVHGIPKKDEILKEGDLLTIDCGVIHKGLYTDAARSIGIGNISEEKRKLIKTAYLTLDKAISVAKPGSKLSEIGRTIQKHVESENYHIVKDLTGHGIGKNLHEDPVVLNYWEESEVIYLKPGMTLAIEPIFAIGTGKMKTLKDEWTIVTKDMSCAVQVENTILITQKGNEVLTKK
jgi:methionyl aminopeptidase